MNLSSDVGFQMGSLPMTADSIIKALEKGKPLTMAELKSHFGLKKFVFGTATGEVDLTDLDFYPNYIMAYSVNTYAGFDYVHITGGRGRTFKAYSKPSDNNEWNDPYTLTWGTDFVTGIQMIGGVSAGIRFNYLVTE